MTADSDDDIDYEDDPPHPRHPQYSYSRSGGMFDGTIKTIGTALIISGIVGFVALVFAVNGSLSNLRESQAVLTASQQFLQQQINDVKADQRELAGKVFRGVEGYDDADQRKP